MSDQEKSGLKVTDKRRFTEEGESRESEEQVSAAVDKKEEPKAKSEEPKAKAEEKRELPQIDFVTFILSLASSVQVHMGLMPNPGTGKQEKNLTLAKQTIDILGVLQEKTKGNLSPEEDKLLEGILYELRLKYVELNT